MNARKRAKPLSSDESDGSVWHAARKSAQRSRLQPKPVPKHVCRTTACPYCLLFRFQALLELCWSLAHSLQESESEDSHDEQQAPEASERRRLRSHCYAPSQDRSMPKRSDLIPMSVALLCMFTHSHETYSINSYNFERSDNASDVDDFIADDDSTCDDDDAVVVTGPSPRTRPQRRTKETRTRTSVLRRAIKQEDDVIPIGSELLA